MGLVTNEVRREDGEDKLVVFVPSAPNPATGRLLLIAPSRVRPLDIPVNEAMKALVSIGKTGIPKGRASNA